MTFQETLERYLLYLKKSGYSAGDIERKGRLLKNWLSCALALFSPGIPGVLDKVDKPLFYYKKKIHSHVEKEKIETVEHFLNILRKEREKVVYLNLYLFLDRYRRRFFTNNLERKQKSDAILSFCRAVGFEVKIQTITKKVYLQCIDYLRSLAIQRVTGYSRLFFIYCSEKNWVSFNPHEEQRSPYARAFEIDFIGTEGGIWKDYVKDYIHYLQFERNLSDGGIDYQVRKLKYFAVWLDTQKVKKPDVDIIKRFIDKKQKDGVKDITVGKYLSVIRYFFDFLVEKGRMGKNPANELRIKSNVYYQGDVLDELEVNRVIECLENEVYETRRAKEIRKMMVHFRAVRDLCLFQIFTFTGLRLSEVSGMKLSDIDFVNRSIKITGKGNKGYRHKMRNILINDYLWRTFTRYLKERNYPGQEYVWISFKGSPMGNSGINKVITARVKQAGIDKRISPHRLRATCASLYVKKGMDPFTLKTLLGHQSIATTMDKYTQLTEEELRTIWKKTNPLAGIDDE
ncbi:MAG: tyrosine-type recombinase/integrase [Spirochaetales bacterium]|nr:tyrosine-type recombinase/integrase [Spirochaetales bacterium]